MTLWMPLICSSQRQRGEFTIFSWSNNCCWSAYLLYIPVLVIIFRPGLKRSLAKEKEKRRKKLRINQFLIYNLHIFLRVNICQADMGQFVDFVVKPVAARIRLPVAAHWWSSVPSVHCWSVCDHAGNTGLPQCSPFCLLHVLITLHSPAIDPLWSCFNLYNHLNRKNLYLQPDCKSDM